MTRPWPSQSGWLSIFKTRIDPREALSRNVPRNSKGSWLPASQDGKGNCIVVTENFPEECRYVLKHCGRSTNDPLAREQGLHYPTPCDFHQVQSGPRMKSGDVVQEAVRGPEGGAQIRPWRGHPYIYDMQKYWDKLTMFLPS